MKKQNFIFSTLQEICKKLEKFNLLVAVFNHPRRVYENPCTLSNYYDVDDTR